MFFDSTIYIVFLIAVFGIYWRLGFRAQNQFLLLASYFFYGWWDWRFLLLMGASTVADYLFANAIHQEGDQQRRRRLMIISVIGNLTVLGIFKYFNFFVDSFAKVAVALGFESIPTTFWQIVLPPAISFYTFQEIAYIVDVYKKKVLPAKRLDDYALFVSFFPHLIAGPIQYPSHLIPQVENPRIFDRKQAFDGLMLFIEGLFRKVVIADNCGLVANAAFGGSWGEPSAFSITIGTIAFAFQIYGDFSGYSSMARGSAQLLGFHFMVNFRQPYLATSLQDFWRRWHISLSEWLKNYLYIPLGGSRGGNLRTYRNLILTMLLGGLWHGASWTFVVWGAIHGVWLSIERAAGGSRNEQPLLPGRGARIGSRLLVFAVVCIAWVFFREPTLEGVVVQLSGLGRFEWQDYYSSVLMFLAVHVAMMLIIDVSMERTGTEYIGANRSTAVRLCVGMVLAGGVMVLGANQTNAFIYFQF